MVTFLLLGGRWVGENAVRWKTCLSLFNRPTHPPTYPSLPTMSTAAKAERKAAPVESRLAVEAGGGGWGAEGTEEAAGGGGGGAAVEDDVAGRLVCEGGWEEGTIRQPSPSHVPGRESPGARTGAVGAPRSTSRHSPGDAQHFFWGRFGKGKGRKQ